AGAPQPKPLRSQTHPFGLPTLQGRDLHKVQKANALARFCIRLIHKAWETSTPFVVENPARAHTWALLRAIVHELPCQRFHLWYDRLQVVTFSACMHGSLRDKRTTFLTSADCLGSLRLDCNRQHEHAAWSVRRNNGQWSFDAAAEAEYPFLLCHLQRLAAAQKQSRRGVSQGAEEVLSEAEDVGSKPTVLQKISANAGKSYATLTTTISQVPQGAEESHAPKGLTGAEPVCEGDATSKTTISQVPQGAEEVHTHASPGDRRFRVGIYHTPMEFVEAALACQHPYDSFDIEDDVARLILDNLTKSPLQLAKERLQAVTKVNQLKKELAVEDTGFPDMGVWDLWSNQAESSSIVALSMPLLDALLASPAAILAKDERTEENGDPSSDVSLSEDQSLLESVLTPKSQDDAWSDICKTIGATFEEIAASETHKPTQKQLLRQYRCH
ncbi:unnamed protein product, partial [Symbiodinium sp. KB8]